MFELTKKFAVFTLSNVNIENLQVENLITFQEIGESKAKIYLINVNIKNCML